MKKTLFGVIVFLFFLNLIILVSAQPFYNPFWYDYWYDFWYTPYPYFLYESSLGFFLIIASLIALMLAPMFHLAGFFSIRDGVLGLNR
ncbi:hypothetical protein HYW75_06495 [Candidatus Pacearchaeota archaeon]|nr:hypothetical protein [Candidatus Pacearchaeota archaeon]